MLKKKSNKKLKGVSKMLELKKENLPLELTGGKEVQKVNILGMLREVFPKMKALDLLSELSVIELPAGCEVKKHLHTIDYECWIMLTQKGITVSWCPNGKAHELFNTTGDVMYIIAIKYLVPRKKWQDR